MKKLLLFMLAFCFMLSMSSCSSDSEDDFHFDLIKKYENTDGNTYYKDTIGGVQIDDYGVKFNVPIYDVEAVKDNELVYYYKYEGSTELNKGVTDMHLYVEYLDRNFKVDEANPTLWRFFTDDDGSIVRVTYYLMKDNAGLMVAIVVPTEGVVGENDDIDLEFSSESAGSGN